MSNDSEKKGGSKAMMSLGFFLMIVLLVLGTWAVLAQSGCTPKNNGFFGSYCNPFPFGEGGSCGGSNGKTTGVTCGTAADGTNQPYACGNNGTLKPKPKDITCNNPAFCTEEECCDPAQERYRRFNRSPRRREGYRSFARRR